VRDDARPGHTVTTTSSPLRRPATRFDANRRAALPARDPSVATSTLTATPLP
jgi:hypothetical protein